MWTDGSASPNPGPGGFAVILGNKPVALGRENPSTNIRMEGMALIEAMKYAKGEECLIVTDSEFWKNVLEKWAPKWEEKEWKKEKGEIKNLELVQEAFELYSRGNVTLKWTRGHVGTVQNELADEWANKARKGVTMAEVEGER